MKQGSGETIYMPACLMYLSALLVVVLLHYLSSKDNHSWTVADHFGGLTLAIGQSVMHTRLQAGS